MKLFRIFILLSLCCLLLLSCGSNKRSCVEIVELIMGETGGLPVGNVYRNNATEDNQGDYASPYLKEALYGEEYEENFALVREYAIYISSFQAPYEIAVFQCYARSDGLKIEQMCRRRADMVSVALRDTPYYYLCDNIRIIREGEYIIFLMTDDPEQTEKLVKGII